PKSEIPRPHGHAGSQRSLRPQRCCPVRSSSHIARFWISDLRIVWDFLFAIFYLDGGTALRVAGAVLPSPLSLTATLPCVFFQAATSWVRISTALSSCASCPLAS